MCSDAILKLSFATSSLIFIYSMMGLLICKYEPFRQEVSVDSQVSVKTRGPLGLKF